MNEQIFYPAHITFPMRAPHFQERQIAYTAAVKMGNDVSASRAVNACEFFPANLISGAPVLSPPLVSNRQRSFKATMSFDQFLTAELAANEQDFPIAAILPATQWVTSRDAAPKAWA